MGCETGGERRRGGAEERKSEALIRAPDAPARMFSTAFATTKFFDVLRPMIGTSLFLGTDAFLPRTAYSNFVDDRGTGPRRVDFKN